MHFIVSFYTTYKLNFLFLHQWLSLTYSLAGCVAPTHYLPNWHISSHSETQNLLVNFCGIGTYVYLPVKIWLLPSFIYLFPDFNGFA